MVLFAHGLEGRPDGAKATALRAAGLQVVAPDGRDRGLAERVADLERALAGHSDVVLVGSSYGGLAALVVATRHAGSLRGLVLCAPALGWREPPVDDPDALCVPVGLACTILHGSRDEILPVSGSQRLADRSGPHVRLAVVDDTHALRGSLPQLVAIVAEHLHAPR